MNEAELRLITNLLPPSVASTRISLYGVVAAKSWFGIRTLATNATASDRLVMLSSIGFRTVFSVRNTSKTQKLRIMQFTRMEYPTPKKYISTSEVRRHPTTLPTVLIAVALPAASLLRVS